MDSNDIKLCNLPNLLPIISYGMTIVAQCVL
jgi:hypothetical protein